MLAPSRMKCWLYWKWLVIQSIGKTFDPRIFFVSSLCHVSIIFFYYFASMTICENVRFVIALLSLFFPNPFLLCGHLHWLQLVVGMFSFTIFLMHIWVLSSWGYAISECIKCWPHKNVGSIFMNCILVYKEAIFDTLHISSLSHLGRSSRNINEACSFQF